jgi:hypothetical protein
VSQLQCLGLFHLQAPDVGAGSGHPDGASIVRPRTDERLIKQDTASCGQAISPIKVRWQCGS